MLLLKVLHDIKEAQAQGWVSKFVKLDVQGTYDIVLHNILIWKMQKQVYSDNILEWIFSYLKHRNVQNQFPGGATTSKKLDCGVS